MALSLSGYAEFLETIPDAALVVDATAAIRFANSQLENMLGYRKGELTNQPLQVLLPAERHSAHAKLFADFFKQPKNRAMGTGQTFCALHKNGEQIPVDIMLKPLEIDGDVCVLCIVRDISELKHYENALKKAVERERSLARTDYLTGAANARHFYDIVQREIDRFQRYKTPFTVAYLDLDNFKGVNDQYGHAEGDKLLCAVVEYLNSQVRKTDMVARLGGDEFALLLPETPPGAAQIIMAKLTAGLLNEMRERHWGVTFSIGVVSCTEFAPTVEALLKQADQLMYSVKQSGKNAVRYAICSDNENRGEE